MKSLKSPSSRLFVFVSSFLACLLLLTTTTTTTTHAWTEPLPSRRRRSVSGGVVGSDISAFTTTTNLWAKGMNRIRNKQGDLKRKLELAKQQNTNNKIGQGGDADETGTTNDSKTVLTAQQIQERNDRLRFEELLKRNSASVLNDFSTEGYLSKSQEEEEINAARAGVERLFEGDVAPTDCFEELVSIKSENAIGKTGKERIVPWLRKNPARHGDYLVVLCDPRPKSVELRQTLPNLRADLPADIYSRLIIINADSPAENRRWLKKSKLSGSEEQGEVVGMMITTTTTGKLVCDIYSDEKLQWMRAYTALGEKRWSMTMFLLSDGRVSRLARDVDFYGASRTIRNAVKSLAEETRLT